MNPNELSLLIIAGGKSSRLGRDKRKLKLGELPLLESTLCQPPVSGGVDIEEMGRGACIFPFVAREGFKHLPDFPYVIMESFLEIGGSFPSIESCQGLKPALDYGHKGKFTGW